MGYHGNKALQDLQVVLQHHIAVKDKHHFTPNRCILIPYPFTAQSTLCTSYRHNGGCYLSFYRRALMGDPCTNVLDRK